MQALRFTPDGPASVLADLPAEPGGSVWCDLAREELTSTPRPAAWFDRLHPLTAFALRRDRPRHMASAQPSYAHVRLQVPGEGQSLSLDVVVGSGFAMSVGARECPEIAHLWEDYRAGRKVAGSVAFALYEALSTVVDLLRRQADLAASDAEAVAERLVRITEKDILQDIVAVRRRLQKVRFRVAPAVDALGLLSARAEATGEEARAYLEDVHRQIEEVLEVVDAARDVMGGAVEQYTSVQSTDMNRVMQLFTVIAVLFAPPTLIASIYGMNFRIPEYHWPLGYVWALGLMFSLTAGLYIWLRSRRWL